MTNQNRLRRPLQALKHRLGLDGTPLSLQDFIVLAQIAELSESDPDDIIDGLFDDDLPGIERDGFSMGGLANPPEWDEDWDEDWEGWDEGEGGPSCST